MATKWGYMPPAYQTANASPNVLRTPGTKWFLVVVLRRFGTVENLHRATVGALQVPACFGSASSVN